MGRHKKNIIILHPENSRNPVQRRFRHDKLVEKLLEKSTALPKTWKQEYDDYKEIYGLLQEIQKIEKDFEPVLPNRVEHMDNFLLWCQSNGTKNDTVTIKEVQPGNFGVIALSDLAENDLFFTVPRKIMITSQTAQDSRLGPLIEKDPIMQHMPSVVLSLHLLNEFATPNSFWKPYITDSVKNCRSIARQYAYFYKMLQVNQDFKNLPLKTVFTYNMYRWAVSAVMTRQNCVPTSDPVISILSLVPLWDMCNHSDGKFSTDVDLEKEQVNCYAMRDFKQGEEVYIFYGVRTNAEFFVHNGFIYIDNQYDAFPLKLGISKGDPLYASKSQVCTKLGVSVCGDYYLRPGPLPIEDDLFNFAKIFSLDKETLENCLEKDNFDALNDPASAISSKALTFIENRLALLQCTYSTTLEMDNELLLQDPSENTKLAITLRILEKRLLGCAIVFLNGGELPTE